MPSKAHNLIHGLAERDTNFYEALMGEDDLGLVIRAHIHIEHELRNLIEMCAPNAEAATSRRMDFEDTVHLALVLGMKHEFRSELTAIGTLRNKFAHRLGMKIDEEQASNLYQSLRPYAKETISTLYKKTVLQHPSSGRPLNLKKLPPKDRVVLYIISIRAGVLSEVVRLKRLCDSEA
jgi:hypothetical protein